MSKVILGRYFDWITLTIPILLSSIGLVSILSTTSTKVFSLQLAFIVAGVFLVLIISMLDFKIIINYSYILFIIFLLITALTLFVGVTRNGAQAWFAVGSFTIQPSEFLKILYILLLSRYLASFPFHSIKTIFLSFLYSFVPVAVLLFLQRDIGTLLVFFFIWAFMILHTSFSNIERKKVLITGFFVLSTIFAGAYFLLTNYQSKRIEVFPDHLFLRQTRHLGVGYQVDQSLISIGSAGFLGKGIFLGTQNQLGFLPEKHNDFIFASIVEELGVITGSIVILLYALFLVRLYVLLPQFQEKSLAFFLIGCISLILYQSFQNIGMNLGIMPVTGISLPFMSYGGSFIITMYMCLGCIQAVFRYKKLSHFR